MLKLITFLRYYIYQAHCIIVELFSYFSNFFEHIEDPLSGLCRSEDLRGGAFSISRFNDKKIINKRNGKDNREVAQTHKGFLCDLTVERVECQVLLNINSLH